VSSNARRGWLLVWLALAAALVWRATARPDDRGVIRDSLEFGRRLVHGDDLYGPWHSGAGAPERPLHAPYPPSFGLLTAPFAAVEDAAGLRAARGLWALLQVAALVAIARVLRRLPTARLTLRDGRWPWLWLFTLLIAARFVLRDMHGGGGNLVNTAFCLLAWDAAERERPGRAGCWLGLSLATKPTQVLLLPVLWLLGRGRAAATGALCATALAAATLPMGHAAAWQRWFAGSAALAAQADVFAVPAYGFPEFEWMNQSLRCALARWLGAVPPAFAARVRLGVLPGLGLPPAAVAWLTRLVSLGAVAWLLRAAHRARAASGCERTWALAAALALSMLLSPLSWKAHYVALLPLLFLLVRAAVDERRRGAQILLAAFVLTCTPGADLVGDDVDELGNSLYLVTAVDVLLFAVAVRAARSGPAPAPAPAAAADAQT
jgi:hypothetical protein